MPNKTQAASIAAACAMCLPLLMSSEGWRLKTYLDPVKIPTVCAGLTGPGIKMGQTYTDAECRQMTQARLDKEAQAVAACLPASTPVPALAAFLDLSHNIGIAGFCASRPAREARAGQLAQACRDLQLYVYAGGKKLPGLVTRRAAERALCEKGLR